jgi:hypothetical protein
MFNRVLLGQLVPQALVARMEKEGAQVQPVTREIEASKERRVTKV